MAASGRVVWVGRAISVLASLPFVMSAFLKLKGGAEVMQGMAHLGLPEPMIMPLAILEISCVVIYLVPVTSILGAILLAGYMGGAICTHWRVGDPFFVQIALGVFVWLGLYLREARLKGLHPEGSSRVLVQMRAGQDLERVLAKVTRQQEAVAGRGAELAQMGVDCRQKVWVACAHRVRHALADPEHHSDL